MSKALSLLKNSSLGLADIAYLCGYSSQQALCNSIKSGILMTPLEYRNDKNTYFYFPVCKEEKIRKIHIETKKIPQMICIKFYHSTKKGIEDRAVTHILSVLSSYTGLLYGRNGVQRRNRFCYELYIEYSDENIDVLRCNGLKYTVTPAYEGTFAVMTVKNMEQEINNAWNFLYGNWIKTSMFEPDQATNYFEEYIIRNWQIKSLRLYLPVKPRSNFFKINICRLEERLVITSTKTGQDREKHASNTVVNYIAQSHPNLLHTQKEYYVSEKENRYTCGMVVENPVSVPEGSSMKLMTLTGGLYAIIEGSCLSSATIYEEVLLSWLSENGFDLAGAPFSIYDTTLGTKPDEIIVKAQVRIDNGRIL